LNAVLNDLIRDRQPPEVIEAARRKQPETDQDVPAPDLEKASGEVRKFFVLDAERALEALAGLSAKLDYLDDAEMKSYVVAVHGLKSSLANIGEMELSGLAFKLERAGQERDIAVVAEETPLFLSELRGVIAKVKPRPEHDAEYEETEASEEDTAYLREKLLALKAACAAYDKKTAKALLDELRQKTWPAKTKNMLDAIGLHLLHSAFKKAADAAEAAACR
jgi:HPt (histidine-containing phosphotransfer) domain-containing protein